jgi:HEAT repeat protein
MREGARWGIYIGVFLLPSLSFAIPVPPGFDRCPALGECLQLLNSVVPAIDDGEGSNSEVLARDLERFGEPAKQELLKRAAGSNPGWRNVAGAILWSWDSWSPADVPALSEALRKDSGGWVAKPLGEIGTPDAIRTLVEDLAIASDSENQTGFALAHLGANAVPFLFPLLETDRGSSPAAAVLKEIGPAALPFLPQWKTLAMDEQEPNQKRIAALRAIEALGPLARGECEQLHSLLGNPNRGLKYQTKRTLQAVRDPILLDETVDQCQPKANPFDSLAIDALVCLRYIASYGTDARAAGPRLMPFLASYNGAERSYGVTVLGAIGDEEAGASIRDALGDSDWRVVYSAARSLGWLGTKQALPNLDRIASSFWLPEIREMAEESAAAIRSTTGRAKPFSAARFAGPRYGWGPVEDPMGIDRWILHDVPVCSTGSWEWQRQSFILTRGPRMFNKAERSGNTLSFQDGKFIGTNHGEWGGALLWQPKRGKPVKINDDNVIAIFKDGDNAVAVFGLSHMGLDYGYAMGLTRNPDGAWAISRTTQLFAEPEAITALGNGRFAVLNVGRVFVFSSDDGILGLATCK